MYCTSIPLSAICCSIRAVTAWKQNAVAWELMWGFSGQHWDDNIGSTLRFLRWNGLLFMNKPWGTCIIALKTEFILRLFFFFPSLWDQMVVLGVVETDMSLWSNKVQCEVCLLGWSFWIDSLLFVCTLEASGHHSVCLLSWASRRGSPVEQ